MGTKSSEEGYSFSATGKVSLSLLIGAGIGSAITYYFTKRYYSKKADEAINSVMSRFSIEKNKEKKDISMDCSTVVGVAIGKEPTPSETPTNDDSPYAISVDEYLENDDYDKETLIYYDQDEVLTDQYDHMLFLEAIFGTSWPFLVPHIGEDDEDVLYCRNPKLKTDYEIVIEHKISPEYAIPEGDEDD